MQERQSWDEYFMGIAEQVATRATCLRGRVGAVLVCDRTILSTGYNGSIRGLPHCQEVGCTMENGHCVATVHAEANALIQAAKNGVAVDGATIYTTASPCWNCLKLIANSGCKRIVYGKFYRDRRVFEYTQKLGIELVGPGAMHSPNPATHPPAPKPPTPREAGRLVVVEGLNGSGKTTLAKALAEGLRATGREVVVTQEPWHSREGQYLRELTVEWQGHTTPAQEQRLALLFAADRLAHDREVVLPALARGAVVLCNRRVPSSLAYQGPACGPNGVEWVRTLNSEARVPEVTLVLACTAALAAERMAKREGTPWDGYFEVQKRQQQAERVYRVLHTYPEVGPVEYLESALPPEELATAALERVAEYLGQ